jgi:hypothetical protein
VFQVSSQYTIPLPKVPTSAQLEGKEACCQQGPGIGLIQAKPSLPAENRSGSADYDAVRTKTTRRGVTTRPTEAAMHPSKDACAWMIHRAQDHRDSWSPYVLHTPDAAMRTSQPHVYRATLGRFSRDGDFDSRRGLYIKEVQPQDAWSITLKFFQDLQLQCPKHIGATATIFMAAQLTGTSPDRTMDGCCHYHFKTPFKPGRKCRRRRGLRHREPCAT